MRSGSGFLAELKRRHVWRVAIAYAVTAWLLLQLVSIVLPTFGAPGWVLKVLIVLFVIFFPVALILTWAFEITPEGVRRTEPAASPGARAPAATRALGRKLNTGIIVALVIAVALLLGNEFFWHKGMRGADVANAIPAKSIAVLPFENLSTDKGNAYFADGMQDLILTKLADIGGLKVISRTSTMKYKSHPDDLKTIAQQLGVATILEGSVQKSGDTVLINVQLIDAKTDAHLWAQAYTRTLTNIFGVEGEVAEEIATALKATLSPAEAARVAGTPTENPKAYNLFLRAEYVLNASLTTGTAVHVKPALPLYRAAVAADSGFALAWARLSYAESLTAFWGGGGLSVPQLEVAARNDAAQAQRLAPDAAATQLALGYIAYYGQRDYAAALTAFRAVLVARPNDTEAMEAAGYVLRRQNRYNDAIAEFRRALALDPRNADLTFTLARTYVMIRRYAQALAPLQRAIALDPGPTLYRFEYAWAIVAGSGDLKHAMAVVQGDAPPLKMMRVWLLTWQHQFVAAITLLQGIPDTPDIFGMQTYGGSPKALRLADIYALEGDKAHARPLYASARTQAQERLKVQAGNTFTLVKVWSNLADAELGLGERQAAFAATAQSLQLVAQLKQSDVSEDVQLRAAGLYAQAGRADLAVPFLAKLLAAPDGGDTFAPVLLRLNPGFDPIRHDPRFQALLKQYPAPAATVSAH